VKEVAVGVNHVQTEAKKMTRRRAGVLVTLLVVSAGALMAQTATSTIQATGNGIIHVTPDQAELTVSVVTQGSTAQDAGQQNATATTAVINALKSVIGNSGTVQTIGYSVYPRYNQAPNSTQIIGYSASNTVQVTTTNLSIIGTLIDTANQAGASSVGGLSFGLQDPEPAKQQALTKAAQVALQHAGAIAAGVGRRTGSVISASEGYSYAPVVASDAPTAGAAAPTTPVQTGTVTVSATVSLTVQLQ
jgi:uncharacterized protein YggE